MPREQMPPSPSGPKSLEDRERAVSAIEFGEATVTEAAQQRGVSRKTLHLWLREARAAGGKVRPPRTAGRPRATTAHGPAILALVEFAREAVPAARTTAALRTWLAASGGPTYRESTMVRKLREWGFTSRSRPAEGDDAAEVLWTAPGTLPFRIERPADNGPAWLSPRVRTLIAEYLIKAHSFGFTSGMLMGDLPGLRTALRLKGGAVNELEAHLIASGCLRKGDRFYTPGTPIDKIR